MAIQPTYLSLTKLLNGRLFEIPGYQRAYSWTPHQRTDLFADIEKTHVQKVEGGHFMAAIVCLRRRKQTLATDEYFVLEVVDGQQRLTTLIILLNAIQIALDVNESAQAKLSAELRDLLVKAEGDQLLLLQTNHDSSHYFSNYLRRKLAPTPSVAATLADRELLQAIAECAAFVSRWKASYGEILSLAALLKNQLHFLLHEVDDEKTVYTVFEVLNSRGLEVAWLDRLKSIIMGSAFELQNTDHGALIAELHTTWRDIYGAIGLRQGLSTEALRFSATLLSDAAPSRSLGEQDSVELLRNKATTAKAMREVASFLLRVTEACDGVIQNNRLNAVTRISQARLLAVALNLTAEITDVQKTLLLERWEKVTFRIYGMIGNDARTRVGEYVRLAWRVINEKMKFKQIDLAIKEIGADFSIDTAVATLEKTNCYEGWESELRYFMFRYEEALSREMKMNFSNEQWEKIWMVSPSESIEHIWSKNKAPAKHRHCIGNLVLLPPRLNSKLQDLPPKKKCEAYKQTGLLIAGQVAKLIDKADWDAAAVAKREKALLKWAAGEWAD